MPNQYLSSVLLFASITTFIMIAAKAIQVEVIVLVGHPTETIKASKSDKVSVMWSSETVRRRSGPTT